MVVWHWRTRHSPLPQEQAVVVAVCTCMVDACSSINWLLQLPGAVLLIGRAPFVYWGVSNYCALTEVFLLPRIQLCSLHRLRWLLLSYDYRHDYFLVSSMLKLSSLKPSKYTRWTFASIGRFVTHWLSGRILSAIWRILGKRRRAKTFPAIHKSDMPR